MPRNGVNKGGHGGARRGAGRKRADHCSAKQQPTLRTMLPLEYILAKLNGIDPVTGERFTDATRPSQQWLDRIAILILPFFQPWQPRWEESEPKPKHPVDLTKLTDEELAFMERILMKAQIRLPTEPTEDIL